MRWLQILAVRMFVCFYLRAISFSSLRTRQCVQVAGRATIVEYLFRLIAK